MTVAGLTQASSVIAGGQVQRGGVGDRDPRARAVEAERLAVLAGAAQVVFATVPVVAVPRRVSDRRARPLVERIRGDRASARSAPAWWRWRCCRRGRGCRRRRWRGPGSCSWCRRRWWCRCSWWRSGGGRDLGEVGAAGALAALDLVAGDGDVVGGGAPAEVDPGGADRGRASACRAPTAAGVGAGRGGGGGVGVGAEVAGGVVGADAVAVAGAGGGGGVAVAGGGAGRWWRSG